MKARWLGLALCVSACGTCGKEASPKPPEVAAASDGGVASAAVPEAVVFHAKDLAPVFVAAGPEGALPDRWVIEFARPVFSSGQVNQDAGENTRLRTEPRVAASRRILGLSTLALPVKGLLDFDTEYQVTLESVDTLAGVLQPPEPGAWTFTVRTPPLAFLRHAVSSFDLAKGTVTANVEFSGPVSLDSVKKSAVWQVDGSAVEKAEARYANGENTAVTFTLTDKRLRVGSAVRLFLKEGVSATRGRQRAKSAEATFTLKEAKRLDVTRAMLREGGSGFFVDVWCRDNEPAAPAAFSWDQNDPGYDPDYDWRNGRGKACELDERSAEQHLSFSPPVKFSLAPGRDGFRVFGDFKRGEYTLKLAQGLSSTGGGVLLGDYTKRFTVPARKPQLSLGGTGRYLPRSAWKNLAITHQNVDQAELSVRRIPYENLVFWLSDEGNEAVTERVADVVHKQKLTLKGAPDESSQTYVDVSAALPGTTRGVLEVSVQAGAVAAKSRLLLTDLSLIAKRSPPQKQPAVAEAVQVWALDMVTNELVSGVEVALVKKSGKRVGSCTTSSDGCRVQVAADPVDDAAPFALVARKGDDVTYIRYADLKTDVSEADVQGEPFLAQKPYRASAWLDRGVYRPGETAHLAAVVRDAEGVAPPSGLPVELRLIDPRQRVARKVILKTNEAGLVHSDLSFEAYADTGVYRALLFVAEREVGVKAFNVEEFVPERMKVTAAAEKDSYLLGEPVAVVARASYLFGGSAQGSPVEATCTLEPGAFRPKANAHFTYGPAKETHGALKALALGQAKATVDGDGQARLECPAPTGTTFRGPALLAAQVSVFEAGSGRSTQARGTALVHPDRHYVGLASGTKRAKAGEAFTVQGAVVDWNGALVTDGSVKQVEVEYARLESEYGFWWDEEEGGERRQQRLRAVREGRTLAELRGGKFELSLTPQQDAARYLVRARVGQSETELVLEGEGMRWWWWGEGQAQVDRTPRPQRPTSVELLLPEKVKVGEGFEVTANVPWKGRALFTLETDRLVHSEWRSVEAGPQKFKATLGDFFPNVYASVLVVKDPRLESKESFLPERAFGVKSVPVEPVAFVQAVKLTAPAEVRSNSELAVTIETQQPDGPTYATVAAVDEGILQLTRFPSPDPLAEVFVRRALGVETYETVGWTLLSLPQGQAKKTGGDGSGGASGRVQPVKPVALWSGVVKVLNQKATVRLRVPQYRGQLRVMVVTVGPKRLGKASAQVTVRDPLVVQTTLPRFLTFGDTIQVPVFVTNVSGKPVEAQVELLAENLPFPGLAASAVDDSPLELLGKRQGSASLADGKSATLVFQARARKSVGAARLTVVVKGGGFEFKDSLDVPFTPSGPRERVVQRLELKEGDTDLKALLSGWVPTTEQTTVWVSANPYGKSFDHLRHLIRYPYGCIEQTTSTTRPLLFVSGLLDAVDPTMVPPGELENMVMSGVRRLLSMQTATGGFSYWPGATEPVAWGTAYATHALLDAKRLGYDVPQERLDDALRWAGEELDRYERNTASRSGYYADHGGDAEPYLHYVLALAGKGRKASVQKLIDRAPQASSEGQKLEHLYLLRAALYLAGDRRYEKELKALDVSPVLDERKNGWSFYSDRRRRGLMLSTFEDLFKADPAGEPMAQLVAEALASHPSGWYTTQELVWGVTGLGKRVGTLRASFSVPTLTAGGKSLPAKPNAKVQTTERTWALARASEYPSLSLRLDNKGAGRAFLLLSSQGVRERATWTVGGDGLKVTRRYKDLQGNVVDVLSKPLPLAQLLFVEIEVTNTRAERTQNLALVDRLPAGWEIENPRLGRGANVEWMTEESQWQKDYLNVRDDRLEAFGALGPRETKKVTYAVRAVTSGTFTLPPVEVEAMYDPRIWAREAGGQVQVEGPWKDFLL